MEIIGRQIEFGIATEAVRGTAETVADKWCRKITANVVEKAAHAVDETTRGGLADAQGRRVVQRYIEGDLQGILHVDVVGYMFANLYGAAVSSQVAATSVYSHVFNLRENIQHQSLTLFAKDGTVQQSTFGTAMLSTFELTAAVDDYVRFNANFVAALSATNADTPSYDTEYDFIARDIVIKQAVTEAGLVGAVAVKAKNLTLTWDTGLIRDHVVGSYNADDIYNSKMMIEGSMTLNFEDEIFKDFYLNNNELYMSVTLTGEVDLDSGENPSIQVLLYKVQITDWSRSGDADALVTQEVSFRAFYNATDAKQSQVTVNNLTTTYPNVPAS